MYIMTIFFLFFLASGTLAGEISLLDKSISTQKPPVSEKEPEMQTSETEQRASQAAPEENIDDGFTQLKEFMRQEDERLKTIKILNLDVERADLELKKRQIELKLADLNKNTSVAISSNPINPSKPVFRLAGIFVQEDTRQALMNVNGVNMQVGEGKPLAEGVMLKRIDTDTAVLKYPDGKEETLYLGS